MNSLSCQVLIPEIKGLKDQEITVGRHVLLQCRGDVAKVLLWNQLVVKTEEKNPDYKVKVLKAQALINSGSNSGSNSELSVDLTFYGAGEYKYSDFILSDGQNEIHLGSQNFRVESVIEKSKDQKPPEPFGPVLPALLSWPLFYTLIILGISLLFLAMVAWVIQRRLYYRKLVAKLKDYDSSVPRDLQFYKAVRSSEASPNPLQDLEYAFRLFILRAYKIPAFDLKDNELISYFKKVNPWFKKERLEIKKILSDIQLVQLKSKELQSQEFDSLKKSLTQKMYLFADRTEELLKRTEK